MRHIFCIFPVNNVLTLTHKIYSRWMPPKKNLAKPKKYWTQVFQTILCPNFRTIFCPNFRTIFCPNFRTIFVRTIELSNDFCPNFFNPHAKSISPCWLCRQTHDLLRAYVQCHTYVMPQTYFTSRPCACACAHVHVHVHVHGRSHFWHIRFCDAASIVLIPL
jgi:hypothetical protein